MRNMITLLKRELWEHQSGLLRIPFLVGTLMVLVAFCSLVVFYHTNHYPSTLGLDLYQSMPKLYLADFTHYVAAPFIFILWLTVFHYFLSCLFDDRKNQSVLFWQSMPVSQAQTLLSKVLLGMLVAPLFAFAAIIVTEVLLLLCLTVFIHHLIPQSPGALWNTAVLMKGWGALFLQTYLQALVLFPLFAWSMLCSAYAKKSPFMIAITLPLVLVILEWFFDSRAYLTHFVSDRLGSLFNMKYLSHISFDTLGLPLLIGVGVGLVFLIVSGMLRSYCYDFE
jgi:ABC-2 type transport system permease protein